MATITDEFMQQMLRKVKSYTVVILKAGPKRNEPGVEKIVWEHGRRNFALRADGKLSIVCPVTDKDQVRGIYIFNAGVDEVKKIMDEDPAVSMGALTYELHPCQGFPGDSLPS